MKFLPMLSALIFVAGCRTAAPTIPIPSLPKPAAEPRPIATAPATSPEPPVPPAAALQEEITRKVQIIEALVSQNDTLTARLATLSAPQTATPNMPVSNDAPEPGEAETAPDKSAMVEPMPKPATPAAGATAVLVPNADGIIDLTVLDRPASEGETVNPFAVRSLPPDSVREVALQVAGVISGNALCALVNGHVAKPGDIIDTLTLETIEAHAVVFRHQGHRLRLPVAAEPVRVRLPL